MLTRPYQTSTRGTTLLQTKTVDEAGLIFEFKTDGVQPTNKIIDRT